MMMMMMMLKKHPLYIDIAILSVRLPVRPFVREVPILYESGLTYRHNFFTTR